MRVVHSSATATGTAFCLAMAFTIMMMMTMMTMLAVSAPGAFAKHVDGQYVLIGDLMDGECMSPNMLDPEHIAPARAHNDHRILGHSSSSSGKSSSGNKERNGARTGGGGEGRRIRIRGTEEEVNGLLEAVIVEPGVVNLTWSGIAQPTNRDYISMHCPAERLDIIDWIWANHSDTQYLGFGWTLLEVLDTRTGSCAFRYFSPSGEQEALSNSVPVTRTDPYHIHLALTEDPTEMVVQWVMTPPNQQYHQQQEEEEEEVIEEGGDEQQNNNNNRKQVVKSNSQNNNNNNYNNNLGPVAVRVGLSPDALTTVAFGMADSYGAGDLCESPANSSGFLPPGMLYTAMVRKLALSTLYYYRIDGSSRLFNFTTRAAVGDDGDLSFVVYADQGIYDGTTYPGDGVGTARNSLAEVMTRGAAIVLHPGDLGYAMGSAYVWDKWFHLIEPYASLVPYMVGAGNHEVDVNNLGFHPSWGNFGDDSQGECGVPMVRRFAHPAPWAQRFWYSFDYQSVHFVMLNSEANCSRGSEQHSWLQADLAAVDRCATPFVVLLGHRAMYNSEMYEGDFNVSQAMKEEFEDLLYKYEVDLAIWGHYHAYQRTCPVYRTQCGQGPVHVTVGCAGAALDDAGLYNSSSTNYSQFFEERYGFGRLRVSDSKTRLTWEYMRNSEYPSVADSVDFTRRPCTQRERLNERHRRTSGFEPCAEEEE
jgi:hypothetical protein